MRSMLKEMKKLIAKMEQVCKNNKSLTHSSQLLYKIPSLEPKTNKLKGGIHKMQMLHYYD